MSIKLNSIRCTQKQDNNEKEIIRNYIKNDYSNSKMLQLTLIPTKMCNFACRYCYQNHSNEWMDDSVCNSIIKFVSKNISKYELLELGWFGGEPLCAIDRICSLTKKISVICIYNNVNMISTMSTNGFLLTPENFDKLYKLGIYGFQITLDGLPETHDHLRPLQNGGSSFDRIINNLLYIKKNVQYSKAKIIIRINISKDLSNSMIQFLECLAMLFSGDQRFSIDFEKIMDLGGSGINDVRDQIVDNFDFVEYLSAAKKLNLGISHYRTLLSLGGNICRAGRKNAYVIDYDGKVKKCTAALEDEINHIGFIDIDGNLNLDLQKVELWQSEIKSHKCDECDVYSLCFTKACPYSYIKFNSITCPNDNYLMQLQKLI